MLQVEEDLDDATLLKLNILLKHPFEWAVD